VSVPNAACRYSIVRISSWSGIGCARRPRSRPRRMSDTPADRTPSDPPRAASRGVAAGFRFGRRRARSCSPRREQWLRPVGGRHSDRSRTAGLAASSRGLNVEVDPAVCRATDDRLLRCSGHGKWQCWALTWHGGLYVLEITG
jgi:hypothetical protein